MNRLPELPAFENSLLLPRFRTKAGETAIALRRIVYLSGQGNYTVFHLVDGEQVITTLSLSFYTELLERHGFLRVHKSCLLNLHYLMQCRFHRFYTLTLPDQRVLCIARRRRKSLKLLIQTLLSVL